MAVIGGINDLFTNHALRRLLLRIRFPLFLLLVPFVARFMDPRWLWPGLAVAMVGQLIQTWCFSALVKDRELTIRGPYLLVRNPMYLGRYFLILGFVLLLNNLLIVVAFTIVYYLYMFNRVRREEGRLGRAFGPAFEDYCGKVNRFVPSLRGLRHGKLWFFDRGMFLENNAHWNIVLTLAAFATIYGAHLIWFKR